MQNRFKNCKRNKYPLLLCVLILLLSLDTLAQKFPKYPDSLFSPYYHQRVSQFKLLPNIKPDVVFLGNSITDGGNWSELFPKLKILNRGINGDVTTGVLNRLEEVANRHPKKLFLLIGTNDLARGVKKEVVLRHIYKIIALLKVHSSETQIYVQSIFPVNEEPQLFLNHANNTAEIEYINAQLQKEADDVGYTYIDIFTYLKNEKGEMNLEYSNDGLHLLGKGYILWKDLISPYVFGLGDKP